MKTLLTTLLAFLCLGATAQKKQVSLIGANESEILTKMRGDSIYKYDSLNKETDTSYHITYISESNQSLCNFYIQRDSCTAVIFYYPPEKLPQIIENLNSVYKRTDQKTWVDNSLTYTINLFLDNKDVVKVGFKKM